MGDLQPNKEAIELKAFSYAFLENHQQARQSGRSVGLNFCITLFLIRYTRIR